MKINYVMTCSMMPNQFEGDIDGLPLYFRARHGSYYLEVNGKLVDEGESEHAGWWTKKESIKQLKRSINKAKKLIDELKEKE